jgi:cytoskeleton protein RodZ
MKHNEKIELSPMNEANISQTVADLDESAEQTALFAQDALAGSASESEGVSADPFTSDALEHAHTSGPIGDEPVTTAHHSEPDPAQAPLFVESFAQRLVAARDARGWSAADVAAKLRLPLHIVRSIETEQYERIGQGVYLRGYLTNYARLVGVPTVAAETVVRKHAVAPPELVASGRISHSRYLFDRYSGSALYLVLTGVFFIPLVMFAMNMGGNVGARLTPLDVPAQTTDADASARSALGAAADSAAMPANGANSPASSSPAAADAPRSDNNSPLMASFALVPNQPVAEPAHQTAAASAQSGQLRLSLNEASWVEIVDADGKRLEYATLPAGSVRNYASDKPLTVLLGNTNGARLEVNGQAQDITPFNRGNVARFKLFALGRPISHAE